MLLKLKPGDGFVMFFLLACLWWKSGLSWWISGGAFLVGTLINLIARKRIEREIETSIRSKATNIG